MTPVLMIVMIVIPPLTELELNNEPQPNTQITQSQPILPESPLAESLPSGSLLANILLTKENQLIVDPYNQTFNTLKNSLSRKASTKY